MNNNGKARLLLVSHSSELYGSERSFVAIFSRLADEFDLFLACPSAGPLMEKAKDAGMSTVVFPFRYWLDRGKLSWKQWAFVPLNLVVALWLAGFIRANRIDLVYTSSGVVISGALAALLSRKPHIWHIHEFIGHKSDELRFFFSSGIVFKLICWLSHNVIVNSKAVKQTFPAQCQHKISLVYNGFDLDAYHGGTTDQINLRKAYEIPDNGKVISVIGAISDTKGQKNMVLAMPLIIGEFPNLWLMIVGSTSARNRAYEHELRRIINEQGLQRNVCFTGFVSEIAQIYELSDFVAVASRSETFGRVAVEAMLAGVPVVATRVGGIPEIIRHHETGVLLETRDPEEIANAFVYLLRSPEKVQTYVEEARLDVARRFGLGRAVREVAEILRGALYGSQPPNKDRAVGGKSDNA
jgi:glycosyltransferase involved in cell wall biosynthesis